MPHRLPLNDFYQGRILNFGHRGASHAAPENTIAAFELAARQGADGVEFDVTLTADNAVVVFHDDLVDRTTNGSGELRLMTLAQLQALDASKGFGAAYAGEQIPTLEAVFEAVGQRLLMNIELKRTDIQQDGLEAALADLIQHHNLADRIVVSSFNPIRLRRFRKLAPHVPIGFLHRYHPPAQRRWGWMMWRYPREADHPDQRLINRHYMAAMRRRMLRVNTWTVDNPERMKELRDLGVDMIITNKPDLLRAVLHGER